MAHKRSRRSTRTTQSQNYEYESGPPAQVRQYRERHAPPEMNKQEQKARRKLMKEHVEKLFVIEEFTDLNNSGVLEVGPCLSMFFTDRVTEWVKACENYYKNSGLSVQQSTYDTGEQFKIRRNKNDSDLLFTVLFNNTGFVNVQGKGHEDWGNTDFYTLYSLLDARDMSQSQSLFSPTAPSLSDSPSDATLVQAVADAESPSNDATITRPLPDGNPPTHDKDDSLSFSQDAQSADESGQSQSLQSQPLFSSPEPTLSPIPTGSNGSIIITQNSQESLSQSTQREGGATQSATQAMNLHLSSDSETLTQSQPLFTPTPPSIADSPSDATLVQAAVDAETRPDDIAVTPSRPDDVTSPPQPPPATASKPRLDVTVEDVTDKPTDKDDKPTYASVVDNRSAPIMKSPAANRVSSTPSRGKGAPLNVSASPIPNQSSHVSATQPQPTPKSRNSTLDTSTLSAIDEALEMSSAQSSNQTQPAQSVFPKTTPPGASPKVTSHDPIRFSIYGAHPWLSNLYQDGDMTQFELYDAKWKSREHCYQWRKAIFHEEWAIANAILAAPTAAEAKALGDDIVTNSEWNLKKKHVMNQIVSAFCEQKGWFSAKLLTTGNRPLLENTPHPEWGALNGGANWLGNMLMAQRNDYAQLVNDSPHTLQEKPQCVDNAPPPPNSKPSSKTNTHRTVPSANPESSHRKKVLFFSDSMASGVPLDIQGMECRVVSHSGARVTTPKTAGSDYVRSTTLLKNAMHSDDSYRGLLIGTNDVAHTSVTKFKASYRLLVRAAKSDGVKVLCCEIFHRGDRLDLNRKIDSFNKAILEVAQEEGCACVNSTSSYNSTAWKPNVNLLVGGRLHLKRWAKRTMANRLSSMIREIDTVCSTQRPTRPSASAPQHRQMSPSRHPRARPPSHNATTHKPQPTSKVFPHRRRQMKTHEPGQFDPYMRWDSCYHPDPAPYQQSSNTTWQRYPTSAGYQGKW